MSNLSKAKSSAIRTAKLAAIGAVIGAIVGGIIGMVDRAIHMYTPNDYDLISVIYPSEKVEVVSKDGETFFARGDFVQANSRKFSQFRIGNNFTFSEKEKVLLSARAMDHYNQETLEEIWGLAVYWAVGISCIFGFIPMVSCIWYMLLHMLGQIADSIRNGNQE
jgi:hypothetical protein